MTDAAISALRTQIFDHSRDQSYQDRAAMRLRRVAYALALTWARDLRPDLGPAVTLTGLTPTANQAYRQQWQPILQERDDFTRATAYQSSLEEDFVTYRRVAGKYVALDQTPWGWTPFRFELAIWNEQRLCAVAKTSMNEAQFKAGTMAVGMVVRDPGENNPLRGAIGPLVHCAALAWAQVLERKEIHYLGSFSEAGEKMVQGLSTRYGFEAEARGTKTSLETMRFDVAKNMKRFALSPNP